MISGDQNFYSIDQWNNPLWVNHTDPEIKNNTKASQDTDRILQTESGSTDIIITDKNNKTVVEIFDDHVMIEDKFSIMRVPYF